MQESENILAVKVFEHNLETNAGRFRRSTWNRFERIENEVLFDLGTITFCIRKAKSFPV